MKVAKKLMLTGMRFGHLLVIGEAGRVKKKTAWECQCDCGKTHIVITDSLRSGTTKSCGCLKFRKKDGPSRRKPFVRHPLYQTWLSMRTRCNNPASISYPWYGGRGIKVCERWDSFDNFLEDMGPRPPSYTLDRKNSDKDYSPENCRWTSRAVQARNTRANRILDVDGVVHCATDWAEISGIPAGTILDRIRKGWTPREAIFKPLQNGPDGDSRRMISCFGETMSITQWARKTGISKSAIEFRLKSGWPIEIALSKPTRKFRRA